MVLVPINSQEKIVRSRLFKSLEHFGIDNYKYINLIKKIISVKFCMIQVTCLALGSTKVYLVRGNRISKTNRSTADKSPFCFNYSNFISLISKYLFCTYSVTSCGPGTSRHRRIIFFAGSGAAICLVFNRAYQAESIYLQKKFSHQFSFAVCVKIFA
jgi:hypothetical protein